MIPIGRETLLARFPWATALLAAAMAILFFSTWPDQKAFLSVRWPDSPLVSEAKALSSLALDDDPRLPAEMRTRLEDLRAAPDFPDEEADGILLTIQNTFDDLSALKRPDWNIHFDAYARARKKVMDEKIPWSSVLDRYDLRSDDPLWPRLAAHMWVHAGVLHLLFCLYFLWMAGAHMEEEWGSFVTVLLYVGGGMASALAVKRILPAGDWVLLGGSGAVAALMGALLSRHAGLPLRFFYILGVTYGVFSVPAWAALALWGPGVYIMDWLTDGRIAGPTIAWFHGTGFLFGAVAGGLAGLGRGSGAWQRSSNAGPLALNMRVEAAARLFAAGKAQEAQEIYRAVLAADAGHLAALQGLMAAQESLHQEEEAASTSVKIIRTALELGQGKVAEDVFRRWSMRLFQTKLSPQERLVLAQNLELLQLWREALAYYRSVTDQAKDTPFAGKAIFASGKIWKEQFKKPEDAVQLFRQLLDPPYDMEWRPLAEAELRALGKL